MVNGNLFLNASGFKENVKKSLLNMPTSNDDAGQRSCILNRLFVTATSKTTQLNQYSILLRILNQNPIDVQYSSRYLLSIILKGYAWWGKMLKNVEF